MLLQREGPVLPACSTFPSKILGLGAAMVNRPLPRGQSSLPARAWWRLSGVGESCGPSLGPERPTPTLKTEQPREAVFNQMVCCHCTCSFYSVTQPHSFNFFASESHLVPSSELHRLCVRWRQPHYFFGTKDGLLGLDQIRQLGIIYWEVLKAFGRH